MNKEFNNAYQGLYETYSSSVSIDSLTDHRKYLGSEMFSLGGERITEASLIQELIDAIDKSVNARHLRADARYFLLVNFHQLIIRPVLEVLGTSRNNLYPNKEFRGFIDDIKSDINTILLNTVTKFGEDISGHAIMEAINRIWTQLRTTRIEIWG
ncbi:hypothetical protein [Chitinophaga agri]|uniref:Uncharacterized protein n=1 Tax=Chitinophaga agri TaxID=2703787 RepID=A0A6B9ZCU4_9BACT|nr:hypothetical protein [Chitinophaga agri]QHS59926.1 hypothetical protein GWR21_10080 [Chitinophaga agri]